MLLSAIVLFLMLSLTPRATEVGLDGKVLLFPAKTDDSYVKLVPKKPMMLSAFTLCMRVASEDRNLRDFILFAYRTPNYDELNVWHERDGRVSFYIQSSDHGVLFNWPPSSSLHTHMCFTWSSETGISAFWFNGQRSGYQVYRKGFIVNRDGTVLLGQDPDNFLGKFSAKQSFVGDISDVNMWDYVLSENQIRALYLKQKSAPNGNVLDWKTMEYEIKGEVLVVEDN
ncbi:pentraxin fusion protein-like [Myxocyprinus asiaticus]|uniref:pentraxin fusion protein-like n=1 Tax=Myxocyprinus asiaticus TaxID=70543 RepID=UPI0022231E2C|nr:pentraxin fusion protein-like [Myxocyprinus asiaticus]